MKQLKLGTSSLEVPNIGLGCMRIKDLSKTEAEKVIRNAMDAGINFLITRIYTQMKTYRQILYLQKRQE